MPNFIHMHTSDIRDIQVFDEHGEVTPISQYEMIRDFHVKFELEYSGAPQPLPDDMALFRIGFMLEELGEYIIASGYHSLGTELINLHNKIKSDKAVLNEFRGKQQDLEKQFDGLIDLVYVALGTSHLHGFDFDEGYRRVHLANMKKVRVLNEAESTASTGRGSKYDVKKPEGWTPAPLDDLL